MSHIKLEKPKLPVLLFSAFDNLASVAQAIALGARGFLLKGCSRDEFLNAIRVAAAGENVWSKGKTSQCKPFAENATSLPARLKLP